MSQYIDKSHNVAVLLYHLVLPAKYRRAVFNAQVDEVLKEVCLEIAERYQLKFLEIVTDKDHLHFLVQSVPTYSVAKIVTVLKSISAREVFRKMPTGEEEVVGRGVLDGPVFREHGIVAVCALPWAQMHWFL
jgi:REP element-mobilizing transposase RayT